MKDESEQQVTTAGGEDLVVGRTEDAARLRPSLLAEGLHPTTTISVTDAPAVLQDRLPRHYVYPRRHALAASRSGPRSTAALDRAAQGAPSAAHLRRCSTLAGRFGRARAAKPPTSPRRRRLDRVRVLEDQPVLRPVSRRLHKRALNCVVLAVPQAAHLHRCRHPPRPRRPPQAWPDARRRRARPTPARPAR